MTSSERPHNANSQPTPAAPSGRGGVASEEKKLAPGDGGYQRAILASLCSGLASYNALYSTQAVLPALAEDFHVTPGASALSVSAATAGLALMVIPLSVLSERFGRRRVLQISVILATALSLVVVAMPTLGSLIGVRLIQGLAIAGVPAVMMAFLAEEVDRRYLPRVMGFYIAGNSIGGLVGRLIPGIALDFTNWRYALLFSALFALAMGVLTVALLPRQRFFSPKRITLGHEARAFLAHLRNPTLRRLFVLPFVTMGAFVSLFNYLGFRLIGSFGLPESIASLAFVMYLSGTWSSARAGTLVDRFGRRRVLTGGVGIAAAALALLLIPSLWTTLLATLVFTGTFFAAHSVASAWVGEAAVRDRAEASSCYILCYYLGSALLGWVSGFFFAWGWAALVAWLVALFLVALVTAWTIRQPSRD